MKIKQLVISAYNRLLGHKQKIKGSNNSFRSKGVVLKRTSTKIIGNNNSVDIGENSRLNNVSIFIKGNNHKIIIGEKCVINNTVLWVEDEQCTIKIGNKTTIEEAHIAVIEPKSTIKIGEDCMFSSGIDIRNGDSHTIIDLDSGKRINYAKDIDIENHVWIGAYVQILKGATIKKNSIIGARSVVSKNIPKNCIAVGTPAKVVKNNVTWKRERIYN